MTSLVSSGVENVRWRVFRRGLWTLRRFKTRRLSLEFALLIVLGGIALFFSIHALNEFCAVSGGSRSHQMVDEVGLDSAHKSTEVHNAANPREKAPTKASATTVGTVQSNVRKNGSAEQSEDGNNNDQRRQPEFSYCNTKVSDLALLFLTYCLALIGYFQIRRSEKLAQGMERAHLFCGPAPPFAIISGNRTTVPFSVSNYGRTAGILKEIYGEFSAVEPTGRPRYSGGKTTRTDMGVAPNFEGGVVENFESPFATDHFFYGYVAFVDIFGERHVNRFCNKIFPQTDRVEVAGPDTWNEYD